MDLRKTFDLGMVAGIFLMLGADAFYWLISAWTPAESTLRTALVILQLVVSIGAVAWLLVRRAKLPKAATSS